MTLDGQPRVIRTLTANVSAQGMFVRMPEPLPTGTRVALSLEAGGRALALAQAEVVWQRTHESDLPGRFPGCGVRFTDFLHPRAQELVDYLVDNLDRGKPLTAAPPERQIPRWIPAVAISSLAVVAMAAILILFSPSNLSPSPPEGERVGERGDAPLAVAVSAPPADMDDAEAESTDPDPVEPVAELKATEMKGAEVQAAEVRAAEVRAAEMKAAEMKAAEMKAAEAQAAEVKAAEVKAAEAKAAEAKAAEVKAAEVKAAEVKAAEVKAAEAKAAEVKAAEVKATAPAPAPKAEVRAVAEVANPSPRPSPPSGERESKGTVALPSGAAKTLKWRSVGSTVRIDPDATLLRAFVLDGPPRAVFDLEGGAPKGSHTMPATFPHAKGVRIGKLGNGTRVVVDLDSAPTSSKQTDGELVLSF